MGRARGWTCQRTTAGKTCKTKNPPRTRKCKGCEKPRPKRRPPKHMAVMDQTTYEECVERFGERCGICGFTPAEDDPKLHRDHEHKGEGRIRGLLCFRCNSALRVYMTLEWLRAAVRYLERTEDR